MQKVWIEIVNPTENDKGKYILEMFDGTETHKRYLDLSGQGAFDFVGSKTQFQIKRRLQSRYDKMLFLSSLDYYHYF